MWWDDDPSAGIDEMTGLLKLHGVPARLPRKRLVAEAELHRLGSGDAARDALCARLCELANQLLARARNERRFGGPYFEGANLRARASPGRRIDEAMRSRTRGRRAGPRGVPGTVDSPVTGASMLSARCTRSASSRG
jgi:hypothetical protein